MKRLAEQLKSYSQKDYYPLHMPGHKRNPFSVEYEPSIETDITEIDGFDNLHHAENLLKEVQERAAGVFGARETLFSVNGSTAALLSAVSACTSIGGRILMARNCHKAVYHAAYIRQLDLEYIYPEWEEKYGINGGISPAGVEAVLREHTDIQAVIITSPTYDGVVSDVDKIAQICHNCGIPLIVDEAHGAHFVFHPFFPASALNRGADVVIQSVHKTLPSMTQTALLHRNSERVSSRLLHRYMGIYQSSSPSYPLMASIDSCICRLMDRGEEEFETYVKLLRRLHQQLKGCNYFSIVDSSIVGTASIHNWDPSKIIITCPQGGITGKQLYQELLEKYHLQMEMETPTYALGITSVADTREGLERLGRAILDIDERLSNMDNREIRQNTSSRGRLPETVSKKKLYEAMDASGEEIDLEESVGRISRGFVSLYPPGIPLIVPGEVITREFASYIGQCREEKLDVHGVTEGGKIGVLYE